MVVTVGLAITVVPLEVLRLPDGDQLYDAAVPDAVKVLLPPTQIKSYKGLTLTVGIRFTVTTTLAVEEHRLASVAVTV